MGTITKIYRQTNSLALIIPTEIVRKLNLQRGQYVTWDIDIENGKIVITPLNVIEERDIENGKIVITPLNVIEEREEGEEEVKKDV